MLLECRHVYFLVAIDQAEAITVFAVAVGLGVLDDARIGVDTAKRLVVIVGAWACEWTLASLVNTILGQANVR